MTQKRALFKIGILFVFNGCSHWSSQNVNGVYLGSDGSNHVPAQVNCQLAVVGDALISGIWSSDGEIKKAQLSGKIGYFGNDLKLYVQVGPCPGEFTGTFVFGNGWVRGKLSGNAACPLQTYDFEFKKQDSK